LTQSNEDPSHCLEVKSLITVEDQDKSAKLITKSFHSFGLAGASRTKRRTTQAGFEGLGHGQVASIIQGGLDQFVLHAEVLKAIVELSIGHVDRQLL